MLDTSTLHALFTSIYIYFMLLLHQVIVFNVILQIMLIFLLILLTLIFSFGKPTPN